MFNPSPVYTPLSFLYRGAVSARNFFYDKGFAKIFSSNLPVISIGNVTVGGSGKSPFTQSLAKKLLLAGHRPVILSRGYGGSVRGPHVVLRSDLPGDVGDEALMHLRELQGKVPVVVSRKRVLGTRLIEARKLGDIVLLDDGFQHRQLKRDVNLLLLDVSTKEKEKQIFSGNLLPAGVLREPLKDALKRADALLFAYRENRQKSSSFASLKDQLPQSLPYFAFGVEPVCFTDAATDEQFPLEFGRGEQGIAVSALSSNDSFFSLLKSLGVNLLSKHSYPDHHLYSEQEYSQLIQKKSLPVFTTAKDIVKFNDFIKKAGQVFVLEVEARFFDFKEEQEFFRFLSSRISSS